MTLGVPSPWWDKGRHADRRPRLLARNRIVQGMRGWFDEQGFVEVDTPALQRSPGNEAHLHGFSTELLTTAGEVADRLWLHTSPEFACKKVLAAGEPRIACFAHVYRNRERGPLHHPEFTMLEWYRAGEPYTQLMTDCATLIALAAERAGASRLSWRGQEVDPGLPFVRLTLAQAFAELAGIDLLDSIDAAGATDRETLAAAAVAAGIRIAGDDTWSDIFSRVLVERIEPHLGHDRVTILDEYPAAEAALARRKPGDARVSERFELYACGVELANAFGELADPVEQRSRFLAEMDEKQLRYGERYPLDEDLLAALAEMPPASGIALGLDRLVMLATGARHIEEVLWAPVPETVALR